MMDCDHGKDDQECAECRARVKFVTDGVSGVMSAAGLTGAAALGNLFGLTASEAIRQGHSRKQAEYAVGMYYDAIAANMNADAMKARGVSARDVLVSQARMPSIPGMDGGCRVRLLSFCDYSDIKTLGQLADFGAKSMSKKKNVGEKTVKLARATLLQYGLTLG